MSELGKEINGFGSAAERKEGQYHLISSAHSYGIYFPSPSTYFSFHPSLKLHPAWKDSPGLLFFFLLCID